MRDSRQASHETAQDIPRLVQLAGFEAVFAIKEMLGVLKRDGDTKAIENWLATFADREDAVDAKRWRAIEEKYLQNI